MVTPKKISSLLLALAAGLFFAFPALANTTTVDSCHDHDPGNAVTCTGGTSWCGNTCQASPTPTATQDVNCSSCATVCAPATPCSYPTCTAPTSTAGVTPCSGGSCPANGGVYTNSCSSAYGCPAGKTLCASPLSCATTLSCPAGFTFDPCANGGLGACTSPYVVLSPGAQQSGFITVSGNVTSGGDADSINFITANSTIVDNLDQNSGAISSNSLRFGGTASGEGILSRRTAGGNQWGLDLMTNSISRLSVTSGGNVGIGTSSPADRLSLVFDNLGTGNALSITNHGSGNGAQIFMRGSRGTLASPAATQANDRLAYISFDGHNGTSFTPAGFVTVEQDAAVTGGRVPSRYRFYMTTPTVLNKEVLRIAGEGNVGIGDASPSSLLSVGSGGLLRVSGTTGNMSIGTGAAPRNDRIIDVAKTFGFVNNAEWGIVGSVTSNVTDALYGVRGVQGSADATVDVGDIAGVFGSATSNFAGGNNDVIGGHFSGFLTSGGGNTYGVKSTASGANATDHYGLYGEVIQGTGTNYGVYSKLNNVVGATEYGMYATGEDYDYLSGSLGVGVTVPTAKLDVNGTAKVTGFQLATGAGAGKVLTSDAAGVGTWVAPPGGVTGSGTVGQAAFWTSPTAVGGDDGFFWDNTNKRLRLGAAGFGAATLDIRTNATYPAYISGTNTTSSIVAVTQTAGTNDLHAGLSLERDTTGVAAAGLGTGVGFSLEDNSGAIYGSTGGMYNLWTDASSATRVTALTFHTKDNAVGATEKMRISGNGSVGIGTTTPGIMAGATKYLSFIGGRNNLMSLEIEGGSDSANGIQSKIDFIARTTANSDANTGRIEMQNSATNTGHGIMKFYTNAGGGILERMRIMETGSVGINTTAPAAGTMLDVNGTAKMTGFQLATGAGAGKVLTSDASGVGTWVAPPGGVSGSGVAGQAAFWTSASAVGGDNGFFWDNTNKRLGVGTASPIARFQVDGAAGNSRISLAGSSGALDNVYTEENRVVGSFVSDVGKTSGNGVNIFMYAQQSGHALHVDASNQQSGRAAYLAVTPLTTGLPNRTLSSDGQVLFAERNISGSGGAVHTVSGSVAEFWDRGSSLTSSADVVRVWQGVTNNTGKGLQVHYEGNGQAFRVEDEGLGFNSDTTPFVIDATGNTFIGENASTLAAGAKFEVKDGIGVFQGGYTGPTLTDVPNNTYMMMWYPKKIAFRAGGVDGGNPDAWDDVNIGEFSIGLGLGSKAKGNFSVAIGFNNNSTNTVSTTIGQYNTASGYNGTAIGYSNTAYGSYTTAFGYASEADGTYSIAGGYQAYAGSGAYGIALGRWANTSGGSDAIAMGYNVGSWGTGSTGIGYNVTASGNYSAALGADAFSYSTDSVSIGRYVGTSSGYTNNMAIGHGTTSYMYNNISNSLMVGFNSNIPTLFVGPSAGNGTTGNVGVGTSTPSAKLDVRGGDINMDASTTLYSRGRLHIHGEERLYLLNLSGVYISKSWGGNGNLTVEGTQSIGGNGAYNVDLTVTGRLRSGDSTGGGNGNNGGMWVDNVSQRFMGACDTSQCVGLYNADGWSLRLLNGFGDVYVGSDSFSYFNSLGPAYKPGGGSWTASSDRRVKKDISPFSDGLDVVRRIDPVNFTYNGLDGQPEGMKGIGVIAQEIQKVAPYTVSNKRDSEYLQFDPSALMFVNLNAIKDVDKRLNDDVWGSGSGWVSCPAEGECSCPEGSYMTKIKDRGAQAYCNKL